MELKKTGTKYQIVGMDAIELKQITAAIDHWNNNHRVVGKEELTFEVPAGDDLLPELETLEVKGIKYPGRALKE